MTPKTSRLITLSLLPLGISLHKQILIRLRYGIAICVLLLAGCTTTPAPTTPITSDTPLPAPTAATAPVATHTPSPTPTDTPSPGITGITEINRHRLKRGLVSRMAFSSKSGLLAAAFRDRLDKPDKGIGLYKVDTFAETDFIEATKPEEQISQLALSPDGTMLAGGFNGKVALWAINNNQLEPHLTLDNVGAGWINGLAFSPDGTLLAAGEWSQTIWIWRVQDGSVARKIENAGQTKSLQFSPDGTILAAGDVNGAISLYNVADGALFASFGGTEEFTLHTWGVTRLAFSPDGTLLAATSPENWDTHIWRVSDGALLHTLKEDTNFVNGYLFLPDSRSLITLRTNIHLWDVAEETMLHRQEIPGTFLAGGGLISPDILLTVSTKGLAQLWALTANFAQPAAPAPYPAPRSILALSGYSFVKISLSLKGERQGEGGPTPLSVSPHSFPRDPINQLRSQSPWSVPAGNQPWWCRCTTTPIRGSSDLALLPHRHR